MLVGCWCYGWPKECLVTYEVEGVVCMCGLSALCLAS